jgi:sporulation protein YlmC with PRC-barrel domain
MQTTTGNTTSRTESGHTSAIRANKVIGTRVLNMSDEHIGKVEDIVLDKLSSNILFAVVGFGGFLGMAEKYHPVPWSSLDYDEARDAYVVDFTREQLQTAPSDSLEALTRQDSRAFREQAYDHYQVPHSW